MSWITNRGCKLLLGWFIREDPLPDQVYLYLANDSTVLDETTSVLADISEVPRANGYGPLAVPVNTINFFGLNQDDVENRAVVTMIDAVWFAVGGPIPSSGSVRYMVMTTNEPTEGDRQVIAWHDFEVGRSVNAGDTFEVETAQLRLGPRIVEVAAIQ